MYNLLHHLRCECGGGVRDGGGGNISALQRTNAVKTPIVKIFGGATGISPTKQSN